MNNPLVSIIMSIYKPKEEELDITIHSVLGQTLNGFEFIIIKDDDLIETSSLLSEWANRDNRIQIIENNCNLGLITSLNKGLELSKAPLIARIDLGDWWDPSKLQRQYDLFQLNPTLVVCGTNLSLLSEEHSFLGKKSFPLSDKEIKESFQMCKNPFAHPSVMFRKTSLRYNSNALYCEDFELWCRYSLLGTLSNIPETLTYYIIDTNSITNTKRSLMIANVTKVYCSFLKMITNLNSTAIYDGLIFTPSTKLTKMDRSSNAFYSKAFLATIKRQHFRRFIYFSIACLLNPMLLVYGIKRFICLGKIKSMTLFYKNLSKLESDR